MDLFAWTTFGSCLLLSCLYSSRINVSLFFTFMTIVSDGSLYKKQSARSTFLAPVWAYKVGSSFHVHEAVDFYLYFLFPWQIEHFLLPCSGAISDHFQHMCAILIWLIYNPFIPSCMDLSNLSILSILIIQWMRWE